MQVDRPNQRLARTSRTEIRVSIVAGEGGRDVEDNEALGVPANHTPNRLVSDWHCFLHGLSRKRITLTFTVSRPRGAGAWPCTVSRLGETGCEAIT